MPDPGLDVAADIATLAVARLAHSLGLEVGALAPVRALVERDIKQRYGRDSVHIRAPTRPSDVVRDYRAGMPRAALRQRYGISRATLYRYLKRAG